jgi:hypothetical protein
MKKLLAALLGVSIALSASAEVWEARYGVAETFNFKLYNADGTLDVDEVDGGTEVSVSCNEGAETTATNDFVDEGNFYSIALTSGEMSCERVAVVVAATTTEVFFVQTMDSTSAMTPMIVQTGDSFARIGANGASLTSTALSTAGVNAVLAGQGIPAPTTIATLASQTSFTLTAGSADDNAYNGYGISIRDASTATQQALGCVRDYTGSTRTVTLLEDPAIFTMATADNVHLLPAYCDAQVIQDLYETALLICTVDTANFAGDTNDFACDLTDRAGVAVTANMADNDLSGLEVVVISGAQQYEKRFVSATTDWDGVNSEMRLNVSRVFPATLADNVVVIIR